MIFFAISSASTPVNLYSLAVLVKNHLRASRMRQSRECTRRPAVRVQDRNIGMRPESWTQANFTRMRPLFDPLKGLIARVEPFQKGG